MNFSKITSAKYRIVSNNVIKTNEPIKIEWKIADGMMVITVDGIDYGVIDYVNNKDEIDLDKVKHWVEETYYDDDYKSSQYTAPRLKKEEFKKHV